MKGCFFPKSSSYCVRPHAPFPAPGTAGGKTSDLSCSNFVSRADLTRRERPFFTTRSSNAVSATPPSLPAEIGTNDVELCNRPCADVRRRRRTLVSDSIFLPARLLGKVTDDACVPNAAEVFIIHSRLGIHVAQMDERLAIDTAPASQGPIHASEEFSDHHSLSTYCESRLVRTYLYIARMCVLRCCRIKQVQQETQKGFFNARCCPIYTPKCPVAVHVVT